MKFMKRSILDKLWNASPKGLANLLFPGYFYNRRLLNAELPYETNGRELKRLRSLPRYVSTTTQLMGRELEIVDVDSYFAMCEEIFVKRNYEFEAGRKDPLIIDCGANIGLSIIFFKKIYPDCRIIAFEADEKVFGTLERNMKSFGYKDVELFNKAVWSSETGLDFHAEGSWGGRIPKPGDTENIVKVRTARLKDYLNQRIDFLKMDVEGAETEILRDCVGELKNVEHLFVEYHAHITERQTLHDILSIMQGAGFRYHIKEASPRTMPFIERRLYGMDSQLDIFAYRL